MKGKGFFVAGTDTGIGKTVVTALLADYFTKKGFSVVTQKWVQTGALDCSGDVFSHHLAMGRSGAYSKEYISLVEPYSFSLPASPHLAATVEGAVISSDTIREKFMYLRDSFDLTIVEGTGGLLVPINKNELMVDIVMSLGIEVILVVGNRLGAINQALLSAEALEARKIKVMGMIFNRFLPQAEDIILKDNREVISSFSKLHDLGELDYECDGRKRSELFRGIGDKIFDHIGCKLK